MSGVTLRTNLGMGIALVLLVIGGAITWVAEAGSTLHHLGIGVLLLASVVYLGARGLMMLRDRG